MVKIRIMQTRPLWYTNDTSVMISSAAKKTLNKKNNKIKIYRRSIIEKKSVSVNPFSSS